MEREPLIIVDNISKKFCKNFKRSLWYGLKDIFSELFGIRKAPVLRKDEFWAVKDVSFQLARGECLGLVGSNGAGKSTLLKMLNGLIKPDEGSITLKGRVCSLIELGAGFNPVLTGRENVFNYGIVLGFSHQEILAKYRDIVGFAEMQEFMETPVQNYSSGMKVRLGFAVAAQMEPDVLIIDEVLAVGDRNFKNKCFNRIDQLLSNAAVILVSHQIAHISRLSQELLLLERGTIKYQGDDIDFGIRKYIDSQQGEMITLKESHGIAIDNVKLEIGETIRLDIGLKFENEDIHQFNIHIVVYNEDQHPCAVFGNETTQKFTVVNQKASLRADFENLFLSGKYFLHAKVTGHPLDGGKIVSTLTNIATFEISDKHRRSQYDIWLNAEWKEL